MLKIHMFPPTIAGRIGEGGNPEILAIDESNGIVVSIEVDSQYWKRTLEQLGRLQGVGIIPANQLPHEMGKPS
jgi:hypothetical protein